jgi:hypothetical protein
MKRPMPSGRSPGPGGGADCDVSLELIRLAQLYLGTCRTGGVMCPLLERAWRRFYAETDTMVHAAARSCRVWK